MTTALVNKSAPPATPPYVVGDPVHVEFEGEWVLGEVIRVEYLSKARFGLHYGLEVSLPMTRVVVTCNIDGRNHNYRQQVCPAPPEV